MVLSLFVGKTIDQLDGIGSIPRQHQVFPYGLVGLYRLSLGDNQQVTSARKLQGDAGERLQVAGLARADLAHALGDARTLPSSRVYSQSSRSASPQSL
jgi:hypothetical protein